MNKKELLDHLYWYKATCSKVVDGDTADLSVDLGYGVNFLQRVRFYGINAPETKGATRAAGLTTKVRVEELILHKSFWIDSIKDDQEKYGRYLVRIWVEDDKGEFTCVNDLLVKEGLAETHTY